MRAAVLHGKENIVIEDWPRPGIPDPGEVQVRVHSVGLCGSDLKYFFSGGVSSAIQQPFILGHEVSGEIVAVGNHVQRLAVGDRVVIEPGRPCWECDLCRQGDYNLCPNMYFMGSRSRDGALREYINWPANLVFPLPDALSYEEGALIEPLSVAYSSVRHAQVQLGSRVLVLGAGPIGLAVLQFALLAGARFAAITDAEPGRLQVARDLGADQLIDVTTLGSGAFPVPERSLDIVIDTTGIVQAIEQAFPAIKPGGRLVLVGLDHEKLPLSLIDIVYRQLLIQGVYRFKNTFPNVIHYLASRQVTVTPFMTHRFSLDQTQEALRLAAERGRAIKVMITL
jgi:L-iditol 2-dehydrogenase